MQSKKVHGYRQTNKTNKTVLNEMFKIALNYAER